jgi:hypothetical protein
MEPRSRSADCPLGPARGILDQHADCMLTVPSSRCRFGDLPAIEEWSLTRTLLRGAGWTRTSDQTDYESAGLDCRANPGLSRTTFCSAPTSASAPVESPLATDPPVAKSLTAQFVQELGEHCVLEGTVQARFRHRSRNIRGTRSKQIALFEHSFDHENAG